MSTRSTLQREGGSENTSLGWDHTRQMKLSMHIYRQCYTTVILPVYSTERFPNLSCGEPLEQMIYPVGVLESLPGNLELASGPLTRAAQHAGQCLGELRQPRPEYMVSTESSIT